MDLHGLHQDAVERVDDQPPIAEAREGQVLDERRRPDRHRGDVTEDIEHRHLLCWSTVLRVTSVAFG